ncbi:MAG TPA: hypothetical protein VM029_20375 [Opitutaceae bacterium]|nr:hypothetical protein [Opitutaceae bacterium]
MKNARIAVALVAALANMHALAGQESNEPKSPARPAAGLTHFESAVLSGNQTKQSAYRRVSSAKDPERPVASKDGNRASKPNEPSPRKGATQAKSG